MAIDTITINDANGVARKVLVDNDGSNNYTQVEKIGFSADDAAPVLVSSSNPLPVTDAGGATQATLAAILAKLIAAPATEATLASVLASVDGLEAALAGTLAERMVPLTSATPAQVASSATAVTLQASNASRRSLIIFNDSTAVLYVKYGSAAAANSYTVKMAAGDYWEMPLPAYTGVVTGIWASANGNAYVTEGV